MDVGVMGQNFEEKKKIGMHLVLVLISENRATSMPETDDSGNGDNNPRFRAPFSGVAENPLWRKTMGLGSLGARPQKSARFFLRCPSPLFYQIQDRRTVVRSPQPSKQGSFFASSLIAR